MKIVATASILAACLAGTAYAEEAPAIKIGMVNDQAGPNKAAGRGMRVGANAYFAAVNAKGGVKGKQIKFVYADDGYVPDRTVDEVLKMVEEQKIFAVIGSVGTSNGVSILPIVKEFHLPFVNPRSGAANFRNPVIPEVINIRASHQDETDLLVDHFVKAGLKKFAVFYQNDTFGLDVLTCVENSLKKHGLTLSSKGSYERGTTAVKGALAAIAPANPDVIIMGTVSAPGGEFIKVARKEGLKSIIATGSFGGGAALVKVAGADAEGLVSSQVVPQLDDLSLALTKDCKEAIEKNPDDIGFNAISFEGCVVAKAVVTALEKAAEPLTQKSFLQAFEGMKGVDIGGMKLTLSPDNHQAQSSVWLVTAKGGKLVPLQSSAR